MKKSLHSLLFESADEILIKAILHEIKSCVKSMTTNDNLLFHNKFSTLLDMTRRKLCKVTPHFFDQIFSNRNPVAILRINFIAWI